MPRWGSIAFDIAAITVLAVVVYFPRYRRRDLLFAYVAVNIGVMAVTIALTETVIGVAVGLGLFGVLSIVRLRSAELAQPEIAYYFAALALGLLGGVEVDPAWLTPTLSTLVVVALGGCGSPAALRPISQSDHHSRPCIHRRARTHCPPRDAPQRRCPSPASRGASIWSTTPRWSTCGTGCGTSSGMPQSEHACRSRPVDVLLDEVALLSPTSLEALQSVALLQTRFDRKYVVAPSAMQAVLEAHPDRFDALEINGNRSFPLPHAVLRHSRSSIPTEALRP